VNLLNASYLNYVFSKLGDLCALVSLVNGTRGNIWWICVLVDVYWEWWYLYIWWS